MVEPWFNLLEKTSGVDDDAIRKMNSAEIAFLIFGWSLLTVGVIVACFSLLLIAAIYLWS